MRLRLMTPEISDLQYEMEQTTVVIDGLFPYVCASYIVSVGHVGAQVQPSVYIPSSLAINLRTEKRVSH